VNSRSTALAIGVVLAAALAGVAGYRLLVAPRAEEAVAPPAAASQAVARAAPTAAPALKLAATVPDVRLLDRDGRSRSLHDWAGKSLIVNFWATWCAPCRREIPLLQRIARERAGDGFQVVGIAVDFRDKVLEFAQEMRIDYPLLIGEQEALDAAAAFGVDAIGFPFTVFGDSQGRVVAAHMGELTEAEADVILRAVGDIDAGRTTIEQGRVAIESAMSALQHQKESNAAE
jgi:thiol-disulfide isomerase/thioredoxin